jgi:hypothetical protein
MRIFSRFGYISGALAAMLAMGCGDNGTTPTPDATVVPDASVPPADMVVVPDGTMAAGDMKMAPVHVGLEGLIAVTGTIPLPAGDAGLQPVTTALINAALDFHPVPNPVVHDYDNGKAVGGCTGDHYSVATNKLPPSSDDAGKVVITGYTGGTLITGQAAPSEIDCLLDTTIMPNVYKCGYGPATGTTLGPDPEATPYMPGATPIKMGDVVEFNVAGSAVVGAIDVKPTAGNGMTLTAPADLNSVAYNPTQDLTFSISCAGGACPALTVVNLSASDNPPGATGASPTFGAALCNNTNGATTGTITFPHQAISAMLGCDANGANCDTTLKSVRAVVFALAFPKAGTDSKGVTWSALSNGGGFFAGQGVFGVSAINQ